jgi:hypothetical protein
MRFTRIVGVLLALGAVLAAIGLVVGGPGYWIEGAVFTRASGTPKYSGVLSYDFHASSPGSAFDGNLWIDAALAFLAVAGVAAIRAHMQRSPSAG